MKRTARLLSAIAASLVVVLAIVYSWYWFAYGISEAEYEQVRRKDCLASQLAKLIDDSRQKKKVITFAQDESALVEFVRNAKMISGCGADMETNRGEIITDLLSGKLRFLDYDGASLVFATEVRDTFPRKDVRYQVHLIDDRQVVMQWVYCEGDKPRTELVRQVCALAEQKSRE